MSRHAAEHTETIKVLAQSEKLLPVKSHDTDACFDVFSSMDRTLEPGKTTAVPLGIKVELPEGSWAKIEGRSGLALMGIFPVGGVIDEGYTGEYTALMVNLNDEPYEVKSGDKIAQLAIYPRYDLSIDQVDHITVDTPRAGKGFGSTGR